MGGLSAIDITNERVDMRESNLTRQQGQYYNVRVYLSVIIPAYNEEERLLETLEATTAFFQAKFTSDFEILIVDDGSRDGTAALTLDFAEKHPGLIQLLSYGGNRGKGYAVRYGMLRGTGDWRLFCDADLATPVEEYDVLVDAMSVSEASIGIGSRPLKQSRLLVRQPLWREMLGRTFNKVVQLAMPGIDDTQCGFKLFSAAASQDCFSRCRLDGFAFDVESLYIGRKLGYKIAEVPIRWSHKDGSKVNMLKDGLRMLADLTTIYQMHHSIERQIWLNPSPKR
jgi:dolichyl-phosphate beta-glucosyltransferase